MTEQPALRLHTPPLLPPQQTVRTWKWPGEVGEDWTDMKALHRSPRTWAKLGRPGACHLQENNFPRLNSALALSTPCTGRCLSLSLNKGRGCTAG